MVMWGRLVSWHLEAGKASKYCYGQKHANFESTGKIEKYDNLENTEKLEKIAV